MSTTASHAVHPQKLESAARNFSATVPAILVAYSVLLDPLINLQPVSQSDFSGAVSDGSGKSTWLAQLLVPALFVAMAFVATLAPPRLRAQSLWTVLPLASFLVLAFVSTAWSPAPSQTFVLASYQTLLCCLLFLSVSISGAPDKVFRYIFWVFATTMVINLAFIFLRPPGPIGHQGIYPYKNTLGSSAGCAFILALYYLMRGSNLVRLTALGVTAVAGIVLIASESKTATGLTLAAPLTAFAIVTLSRLTALSAMFVGALTAAIAGSILILIGQTARLGLSDLLSLIFGDATFTGRTEVWSFIASHVSEAPLLGHGYRGFWGIGDLSPKLRSEIEFIRETGSSHNGFLETTLDLGFIGLTILVAFVLTTLSASARAADGRGFGTMLVAIALFVIGRNTMESVILWSTFFDNLLFVLAGLSAAYASADTGVMRAGRGAVL